MGDLSTAISKDNLRRAFRWLISNDSYFYKNFFRDSYLSYGTASEELINDLWKRLKNNTYIQSNPALLLLPKSTCTTRPYTFLTIEDQIVYQALINIIAEKYYRKFQPYYYINTFGNLYAGKKSTFFYRKWINGYRKFNGNIKSAFMAGYIYKATFDLTACYDSIDHKVLSYMLEQGGMSREFIDFLVNCLSVWSSNKKMYKGHGIPQGPMSSGFLAEVFLSYFDFKFRKSSFNKNTMYFRYVDDIVLMGKNPQTLTRALATLDYHCKQVGLFPQTAKIEIKKIDDISQEINLLSEINEEIDEINPIRIDDIEKSLKRTVKGRTVIDKTRFKIYLRHVKPNSKISLLLLEILEINPQYYDNIAKYFLRYERCISEKVVKRIFELINQPDVYQVISASLIDAILMNISKSMENELIRISKKKLKNHKILTPYYKYVLIKTLLVYNSLSFTNLKKLLITEKSWWVKKSLLKFIDPDYFGKASYKELFEIILSDENLDVSLCAALELINNNIEPTNAQKTINYHAQFALKKMGLISKVKSKPSIIGIYLSNICNSKIKNIDWKRFFGINHSELEKKILRAYAYSKSDVSAFINVLDTINDYILDVVHKNDLSLKGYSFGKIGSCVSNVNPPLKTKHPDLFAYCKYVHDLRLQCDLSHPVVSKTKRYTKPIQYKELFKVRKLLIRAIEDINF